MTLVQYLSAAFLAAPAALIACKLTQYLTEQTITQKTALICAALAAFSGPIGVMVTALALPVIIFLALGKFLLQKLDNITNLDKPI